MNFEGNLVVKGELRLTSSLSLLSGAVALFLRSTAPDGWLKCNGAAISRTTYSNLFSVIGTTFGVGDNSTTFNLPDLRGEFIRCWDDGRGLDSGRTFGSFQDQDFKTFAVESQNNNYSQGPNYIPKSGSNGVFCGYWWAPGSGGWFWWDGSQIAPRNYSILACIKY